MKLYELDFRKNTFFSRIFFGGGVIFSFAYDFWSKISQIKYPKNGLGTDGLWTRWTRWTRLHFGPGLLSFLFDTVDDFSSSRDFFSQFEILRIESNNIEHTSTNTDSGNKTRD